uniref:homogentisate 1,2-dioxygenase n=1 Tax=Lotharella oceanica TaxID=641309 RepID=A0A7S2TWK8_9EUKA|mmetsp:Transcript_33159/g.61610  ORF Transcript_33159/g.61610 Transcript_33159/m.61610 type:complete len:443 (+) Transcript_33159:58-1386(+)
MAAKKTTVQYLPGFGAELCSEALPDALPKGQTNPKKCPYGLYAEQLSGTSFTTPRTHNQRIWFYRIIPSCKHSKFVRMENKYIVGDFQKLPATPERYRWNPYPLPAEKDETDFIDGLRTVGGSGSAESKAGFAVHVYTANKSMGNRVMCNSDGDFLIVPQLGDVTITTECGIIQLKPREIAVIQRGHKFKVDFPDKGPRRGYICEVFDGHFVLPDLGPIGANGLANPRDFLHPTASFENKEGSYVLVQKFLGELWEAKLDHSPFDVVAWFGNYVPYKYELNNFVAVNSVTVDHMDPSIFTVLTCQTQEPGVAACDFVIFPPRMAVQKKTFRPPYYHRNCMTEYMGNLCGTYDAKPDAFKPGGGSLHSCMAGHGPDAKTFAKCSEEKGDPPVQMPENSMAFMFESTYVMRLTPWALDETLLDKNYVKCWEGLKNNFDPNWKPE